MLYLLCYEAYVAAKEMLEFLQSCQRIKLVIFNILYIPTSILFFIVSDFEDGVSQKKFFREALNSTA